ncbi:uncharacterized protein LOC113501899 isoform X2 [Trichoplusia ni]|uniref:Uncharacterized protein LOC113501899 isoform X2 n=1 Tax=Trichoplusia ni TaxID=7111 RepID=A0A7E5WEB5_TRINI|nr:uncharacterized protein LOC113501899 isoform X2 [Trichoplusia ni]
MQEIKPQQVGCIPQAFLLDKLKKQADRHKETCNYISSANIKLEAEIKQAEQEISSMLIAQETIKSGNVEIKKEWLMAKIRRTEIQERIDNGKKKYEALWQECKARYESIPFVQKLLSAANMAEDLKKDIEGLDTQLTALYEDRIVKREMCKEIDKKRAIALANFIIHELPRVTKVIKEKNNLINDIKKEIEELSKNKQKATDETIAEVVEPLNPLINEDQSEKPAADDKFEDDLVCFIYYIKLLVSLFSVAMCIVKTSFQIPKLELTSFDLDVIDVSLEKVKIMKNELPKMTPVTDSFANMRTNNIDQYREEGKAYDCIISPYFKTSKESNSHNYSKRKLINILEDININSSEAYNIVKKVNPDKLHKVDEISSKEVESAKEVDVLPKAKASKDAPLESEDIEEVNMSITEDILIPPTQFLDTLLGSQEDFPKKRVSFDIPSSVQINEIIEDANGENESANQTVNSQLDESVASEDSYMKIKDMILKKHNLDLSPQFVYGKKATHQKVSRNTFVWVQVGNYREKDVIVIVECFQLDDDNIVTSKFFNCEKQETKTDEPKENKVDEMEVDTNIQDVEEKQEEREKVEAPKTPVPNDKMLTMEVDSIVASSPKENKVLTVEVPKHDNPVSGLLFTHGTQGIPDSLNASLSTTGYEDLDIPHCIDSSLLLSPKADVSLQGENPEVVSQEVPNFLSGFRKTGFSFFGGPSTSEAKPDPDEQNGSNNNFSFNFGGEKKNRGGLFSLFR